MLMALLVWLLPAMGLSLQLVLWAVGSALFALAWFRLLRPLMRDRTKAGISREAVLGETGQVIQTPQPERRGRVRFTTPVLGMMNGSSSVSSRSRWGSGGDHGDLRQYADRQKKLIRADFNSLYEDKRMLIDGLTMAGVFLALVVITLFLGVKIVPQGSKHVVQRLGKYYKTLGPGLNIIFPYIDNVAYKVTTKDIVLDIPSQEVITLDNAVIIANAVAYINIVSPEKAVYGVEDYRFAIQNLVQTSLRSIIGEMSWMRPCPTATVSRPSSRGRSRMISPTGGSP